MGLVTESALQKVAQLLSSDITHIALGTGTEIGQNDTQLNSEFTRKASTGFIDGSTIIEEVYFDTGELNDTLITTIGMFGDGATLVPNSGKLMLGDNVNISKTNLESLTISCEITIGRG